MSLRKKIIFAVIVVTGIFLAAEIALRYCGMGPGTRGDIYEDLGSDATDHLNICVIGGSTTNGYPFAPRGGFPEWLEIVLGRVVPGGNVQVANCGVDCIASDVAGDIFEQMAARHRIDAVVVYTGHNEWLEFELPVTTNIKPEPDGSFRAIAGQSAVYYNLWRLTLYLRGGSDDLAPGMGNVLPSRNRASSRFEGEDVHEGMRQAVFDKLTANINRIMRIAADNGIEVVLCSPASNIRDWPPMLSVWQRELPKDSLRSWMRHYTAGLAVIDSDPAAAKRELEQAAAIFDGHAGLLYSLGKATEGTGDVRNARLLLQRAVDYDARPCRAKSGLLASIQSIARSWGVEYVDIPAVLDARSEKGIAGWDMFLDNCHPTPKCNGIIAEAVARALERRLAKGKQWAWDKLPGEEEAIEQLGLDNEFRASALTLIANRARAPHGINKMVDRWGPDKHYPRDVSRYTDLFKQALELSESATERVVKRTDPYCCHHLAAAYAELGRDRKAIEWARKSADLAKSFLDPRRLLVHIYSKNGETSLEKEISGEITEILNARRSPAPSPGGETGDGR